MNTWEKLKERVEKVQVAQDLMQELSVKAAYLQETLKDAGSLACGYCEHCKMLVPDRSLVVLDIFEPEDSMYKICRECNAKREGIPLKLWEGKTSKEWDALYKISQNYGILLTASVKLNTLCNEYKGMMG